MSGDFHFIQYVLSCATFWVVLVEAAEAGAVEGLLKLPWVQGVVVAQAFLPKAGLVLAEALRAFLIAPLIGQIKYR